MIDLIEKFFVPLWDSRKHRVHQALNEEYTQQWEEMSAVMRRWLVKNVAANITIRHKRVMLEIASQQFGHKLVGVWGEKIVKYI